MRIVVSVVNATEIFVSDTDDPPPEEEGNLILTFSFA